MQRVSTMDVWQLLLQHQQDDDLNKDKLEP